MDKSTQKKLEDAGYRLVDAEDFLELTEEERGLVELRLATMRAVRELRVSQKMTQKELAKKIESSQSRVAKMEAGSSDVSLDMMFRAIYFLRGTLDDVRARMSRPRKTVATAAKKKLAKKKVN